MQVFERGEYCGNISRLMVGDYALVSTTKYNKQTFNSEIHYHENAHLSLVLEGGCAERKTMAYERLPGTIIYYHAGEPHQMLDVDNRSRYMNIELESDFFERYALSDEDIDRVIRADPEAKLLMVRVYRELLSQDNAAAITIQLELVQLFSDPPKARTRDGLPPQFRLIDDYLHEYWDQQVTLEKLSHLSGLHPVTISKYFSRYFGCTLGEYLRKLKIEQALVLLSLNIPLTELAYRCGFFDQSHFTRTFKQLTGFLPAQYRNVKAG